MDKLLSTRNPGSFYATDIHNLDEIWIDSDYEDPQKVIDIVKPYLPDHIPFVVKKISSSSWSGRVLTFAMPDKGELRNCGCGGYYKRVGSPQFAIDPYALPNYRDSELVPNLLLYPSGIILTPFNEQTILHELGHAYGLNHESPSYYHAKFKRKWRRDHNKYYSGDGIMSYGFNFMQESDKFRFNFLLDKSKVKYGKVSGNIFINNIPARGVDLLFVSREEKHKTVRLVTVKGDIKYGQERYIVNIDPNKRENGEFTAFLHFLGEKLLFVR